MNNRTILFATLATLFGCKSTPPTETLQAPAPPVEAPTAMAKKSEGEELYQRYCQLCHGEAAVGYAADNANQLANPTFLETATTSFLWLGIERGRPGTAMAGFGDVVGGPLSREQIPKIIEYLRSLGSGSSKKTEDIVVAGDPEIGQPVYAEKCASCHGPKGKGETATSLSNPHFLATASDGFIRYAIEHGRPGTSMKAFGRTLTKKQIDGLTRFIRTWATRVTESLPVGEVEPDKSKIVINPTGTNARFDNLREDKFVAANFVAKALEAKKRLVILDARPKSDWLKSHIPGAFPAPFYDSIDPLLPVLPNDDTWILAYCACPHAASGKVVDQLREAGFKHTAVIDEGILVWAANGLPISFGRIEAATDQVETGSDAE